MQRLSKYTEEKAREAWKLRGSGWDWGRIARKQKCSISAARSHFNLWHRKVLAEAARDRILSEINS